MAGITLAQAQTHLDAWLAADVAVANSQSYSIGGRSLTRADSKEIKGNIKYWNDRVVELTNGGMTARRVVPRDL